MGITLAIFMDFGNIPFSKDRFIKFARGTLMVLSNTFKSFVDILLGHVAFLRFNVFIKDCTSLGYVGVRKNVMSLFLLLTMVLALTFVFFLIVFLLEHMYLEVFQLFGKADQRSYQHFLC